MLAGDFTGNSLEQLRSNGFAVLHIPYATIIEVFADFGMDVLFDEGTADDHLRRQIDRYEALSPGEKEAIGETLRAAAYDEIAGFIESLSAAILRRIDRISILPLHGAATSFQSVAAAVQLLTTYRPPEDVPALVRFEVIVGYDNGDKIVADFGNAADAVTFLASFD
jgi:hypothetical protein